MIARLNDKAPSSVFGESHIHYSIPQSLSCCLSGTVNPVIKVAVQLMTHVIGIQKQYNRKFRTVNLAMFFFGL